MASPGFFGPHQVVFLGYLPTHVFYQTAPFNRIFFGAASVPRRAAEAAPLGEHQPPRSTALILERRVSLGERPKPPPW